MPKLHAEEPQPSVKQALVPASLLTSVLDGSLLSVDGEPPIGPGLAFHLSHLLCLCAQCVRWSCTCCTGFKKRVCSVRSSY